LEDTVKEVSVGVTKGYLDSGAIGLVAITFLVLFIASTYRDYKKDNARDKLSHSFQALTDNQTKLTTMFQSEINRHNEVIGLLTNVLQIERNNTKECYNGMVDNQDKMDRKLDEIIRVVTKNA